jgi:diguanylate cyclase (GGDEF)-like protein/PAS domain S-box-containing protein
MYALESRQRLFEQAFDKAAVGLGLVGTDGRWLTVNQSLCRLLGYGAGELMALDWRKVTHPDDIEQGLVEVRAMLAGATTSYSMRKRCIRRDGSWVELQVSVTMVCGGNLRPEFFVVQLLDLPRAIEDERTKREQEKIRLLVENVSDGFIGMDEEGYITEWNQQAERLLQWSAEEAIGRKMAPLLVPERFRERHHEGLRRFMQTGTPRIINKPVEVPLMRRDGSEIMAEMTIGAVRHLDQYYFATFVRDISERKEMELKLHRQATHDHLTGLLNRFEFTSRLQGAIDAASRNYLRGAADGALALMFIDLDGFKQVNDTYGHHAGDQVLTAFADGLQRCVRLVVLLARLAGDEFVVLICGMDNIRPDVETVARKVLDAARAAGGAYGQVSASIGIALYDGDLNPDAFLQQSDAAMYAAKQAGKNRYVFHCDLIDAVAVTHAAEAHVQDADTEAERLAALRASGLLDTGAEPMFDRLTQLAARTLRMPMAYISLVDKDRQWFKSRCGIAESETARSVSLCSHAIGKDAPLIVPDTRKDARFAGSPLVNGEPYLRFYAGVPLHGAGGQLIGTFCVADYVPRTLADDDVEFLQTLARTADDLIGLRQAGLVTDGPALPSALAGTRHQTQ